MLFTLASFAVALGILIAVHEFGHYWAGRKMGVHVLRYSIGFGPVLWSRRNRLGTEFSLSLLPLGGYVKFLDEREGPVDPAMQSQAFNRQSVAARAFVIAAGPLANFILAIALYAGLSMWGLPGVRPIVDAPAAESVAEQAGVVRQSRILAVDGQLVESWSDVQMALVQRVGESGEITLTYTKDGMREEQFTYPIDQWLANQRDPDVLAQLGLQPWQPRIDAVLETVETGSPAELAGLQAGDQLVALDGAAQTDWRAWRDSFVHNPNTALTITYIRQGERQQTTLTPAQTSDGQGRAGLAVVWPERIEWPAGYRYSERLGPLASLGYGVEQTYDIVVTSFDFLGKMLSGAVTPKNLSGPVSIAQLAGQSASYGVLSFVTFLAFISVSLGVVNLIPLPALDGGHLLLLAGEAVRGKPLPERFEQAWAMAGMLVLLSIMSFAIFNDLDRLG